MNSLYRAALDAAGYCHLDATDQNVRDCFIDYVDAGVFSNLSIEDVDDLTLQEMAAGLIKYCK